MTQPTLYHCPDARSLRCLWAVEEVGMDVTLHNLPFPPRAFAPEYRAVNPLMTVPAWVENGVTLTESGAIVERIVQNSPLDVAPHEADYWLYRNWMHRSDATLTFPLAVMIRYTQVEVPERRLPQATADYKAFFAGRAKSIEAALADGRDWLVTGRFTAADIAIGYAAFFAETLNAHDALGEATLAWLERCKARPAFVRARLRQKS